MLRSLEKNQKKIIVLLIIGLAFSLFIKSVFNTGAGTFLSDIFFCISMTFFLYGLWEIVLDSGFFNSLIFGTKCLKDLVRSKLSTSEYLKEDYLEFVNSRNKEYDFSILLLMGVIFLAVSILISIII